MTNNTQLLFIPTPKPHAQLRLICFSYAGGSATTYLPWGNHLHPQVELIICQLPGRGSRLFETPHDDIYELVKDLCNAMKKLCDKPFVFFGHSLGSKVAYELCIAMQQQNLPLPVHFVASAASAPFYTRTRAPIHALPEQEFIRALAKLNGTPSQVLNNPEIMSLCLPALRADFKMAETYLNQSRFLLAIKLTLLGGTMDDTISPSELMGWTKVFENTVATHWIEGNHFFINQKTYEVLNLLNQLFVTEMQQISYQNVDTTKSFAAFAMEYTA